MTKIFFIFWQETICLSQKWTWRGYFGKKSAFKYKFLCKSTSEVCGLFQLFGTFVFIKIKYKSCCDTFVQILELEGRGYLLFTRFFVKLEGVLAPDAMGAMELNELRQDSNEATEPRKSAESNTW